MEIGSLRSGREMVYAKSRFSKVFRAPYGCVPFAKTFVNRTESKIRSTETPGRSALAPLCDFAARLITAETGREVSCRRLPRSSEKMRRTRRRVSASADVGAPANL